MDSLVPFFENLNIRKQACLVQLPDAFAYPEYGERFALFDRDQLFNRLSIGLTLNLERYFADYGKEILD